MIQLNLVDGLMEPVASIVLQDHMRDGLQDHMIGVISQYADNAQDINAELIYSYQGVRSRNYFGRFDMQLIHEIFDEVLDTLIEEVREMVKEQNADKI